MKRRRGGQPLINLKGRKFGRLKVLRRDRNPIESTGAYWICACLCGNKKSVRGSNLLSGAIRSCGCFRLEEAIRRGTRHGAKTRKTTQPEYTAWQRMLSRCYNKNNPDFKNYGRRGIKVAPEWQADFVAFLRDVGPRTSPHHSLDRFPDNDGDYRPGNVRWATKAQQNRNQRRNVHVRIDGVEMTLIEAIEGCGQKDGTVRSRLRQRGWSLHRALELSPSQTAEFVLPRKVPT